MVDGLLRTVTWAIDPAGPDGEVVSLEDVRRADLAGPLFRALHGRPAHD